MCQRHRRASALHSSLQGTVNKVVVILRDWLTDVDRDVLPAVRAGEKSLRDEYEKALTDEIVSDAPFVAALLKTQVEEVSAEIARLPND